MPYIREVVINECNHSQGNVITKIKIFSEN